MPTYVNKQLQHYNYTKSRIHQHTPLQPAPITYGSKSQEPNPLDKYKTLNKEDTKFVQQVTGSFLYYDRAVDPMILHALCTITSQQSAPTENTKLLSHTFLDYMATHPNSIICFYASDMILNVHSDVSYLTAPKAQSQAGGHFFLGSLPEKISPLNSMNPSTHYALSSNLLYPLKQKLN
jgi:hypothetical protein